MIAQLKPTVVRPVTEADRQSLANLIHFETQVHRHLDWRPPLDWIGTSPYLAIEQNHQPIAALACPPDPPGVSWVRLFAVASMISVARAWDELWTAAKIILMEGADSQVRQVAVMPLQRWFRNQLDRSDFVFSGNVLVLACSLRDIPKTRQSSPVSIRPMSTADLDVVREVDQASFELLWQNSRSGLALAYQQSAIATIAEMEHEVVGYQISTATAMGGHLARLAVLPQLQGKGIGYDLVSDLLAQFKRRGAQVITVNTQYDNQSSLALYKKTGFRITGEEYPVYCYDF